MDIYDLTVSQPKDGDTDNILLLKIATWLRNGTIVTSGGSGGGGSSSTVTPHFVSLAASSSQVIPIGAKGWTATILTGTGTVGGVAVAAGFSDSDPNTLLATVTVATNSASTAYVRWNT